MSVPLPTDRVRLTPKEIVMKTLAVLTACMFGFAGACHAAQIASPAIYADGTQNVAFCVVYNGGSTTQTVQLKLFDEAGNVLTGVNGGCVTLPAGQFCDIAAVGISNDEAYACTVTAGNVTNLHGSIILQSSDTSLRSAPLR
jgi:hypothetical protein